MTAIWRQDGKEWRLAGPVGFPSEKELHTLVEQAPQILPLSGTPSLVVVGREVQLGSGYADLIALEPNGRPVVIEVKLARNAEARRAVVAQVLTYAAYIKGLTPLELEQKVLAAHLKTRGYDGLEAALRANDQQGSFDRESFFQNLKEALALGQFRLVIVLDEAPAELVRLVGYLESIAIGLTIDLVTVLLYDVNGTRVLVPQRIDAEYRSEAGSEAGPQPAPGAGVYVDGADDFVAAIEKASHKHQTMLKRLADWALSLERRGLATLGTYHGKSGILTLLPYMVADQAGLVTLYGPDSTGPYIQLWRSVFERRAPDSLAKVEAHIQPLRIGQGNSVRDISDELLDALTRAYEEAAQGKVAAPSAVSADAGSE